ncbi:MAG: caspase family protein [Bacteroidia bacterium]|nr:caspase family protein [Bacteroidia bacterium]
MSSKNIYALLVGIDKYKHPVPALDGCVNDMRAMRDFLDRKARRNGIPLKMEVLENEDATRQNIVSKFETHLTKATKDDIVFFYYSGHGSQEPAHELFWSIEPEKKNETLVCYDSRLPDGMDIADKELATLIDLVAQNNPHILVITDCCNSGDNTRSLDYTKTRQSAATTKTRALDTYILPRSFNSDRSAMSVSGTESFTVPSPRHIALAAAHSFQLAKETFLAGSPRGVFTYSLLEVLENTVGPITYNDLMRRVRGLVQQRTYDQVPQMTAPETDINLNFLDGTTAVKTNYYILSNNRQTGWEIDAGAVHGIVAGSFGGAQTELAVFRDGADEAEMSNPAKSLGKISVKEVSPEKSLVRPEGNLQLDPQKAYRTKITAMAIQPMVVYVKAVNEHAKNLIKVAHGNADSEEKILVKLADDPVTADYKVVANERSEYIITRKSDADNQPLVEQIVGFNPQSAEKVINNLAHIARWERLRDLKNPGSSLTTGSVVIEICHPTENRVFRSERDGDVLLRYRKADGPTGVPRFRIKMINRGNQKLYCSLIYMSSLFGVEPGMLPQGGLWLNSGEEIWVRNGAVLKAEVNDSFVSFGRKSVQEILKVIVSTKEFDSSLYRLQELNLPKATSRSAGEGGSRGFSFEENARATGDDWNTAEFPVTILRED